MEKIKIGEKEFLIEIYRKRVQTMRLRIIEKNKIMISLPWLMPLIVVKKFLKDNEKWILGQNEKMKKKKSLNKIKSISILGEVYEVELKKSLRDSLVILDKKIFINFSKKTEIKKIIDKKMRVLASKLIKEKTRQLAKKYNLNYGNVGIKNQSSRFGSCSGRGSLNFNWQIILFPVDKFEHVILHELTHLTVKNHSRAFWEQLGKYDKNWQENNKWLRKEGVRKFIV
jgi:predicted metal-dependent hydrolase